MHILTTFCYLLCSATGDVVKVVYNVVAVHTRVVVNNIHPQAPLSIFQNKRGPGRKDGGL